MLTSVESDSDNDSTTHDQLQDPPQQSTSISAPQSNSSSRDECVDEQNSDLDEHDDLPDLKKAEALDASPTLSSGWSPCKYSEDPSSDSPATSAAELETNAKAAVLAATLAGKVSCGISSSSASVDLNLRDVEDDFKAGSSDSKLAAGASSTTSGQSQSPVYSLRAKRVYQSSDHTYTSSKRRRWTSEEEQALCHAVLKHGRGNWQRILGDSNFSCLRGRTNVQLKDKWKNIEKKPRKRNK